MPTVTAVAHRGVPYLARENTLDSLRLALELGADAVEFDVRLTRDGLPVVLHDASLKRLWGHERALRSLTAKEVAELTGGGVPSLTEALAATGGARVMVDVPGATAADVRRIVAAVQEAGAADRAYYTAATEQMLRVRAADPAAEIALTWTSLAPPRPGVLAAVAPRWLNYRFGLVDRDLVRRVHDNGLLVSAWTPDTRRSMRRLLAAGVDSLTTNRLDVLLALRGAAAPA
ncbi:glycerophosphodiester phosphodiesterase [Streptomyces physcomitrii]|uniref:Glycerophosphodiester phosphodiesterase n=1 Tax=Streptomyces physcomitrii TaxID=2724184 RepID=A0ABX1HAN0_9ACTN|nr:glycerophosphodiester phosphodiesterase [Streptomyces physcomitrii]NKI45461.1 glycerophosphodiester phosphodiesterase [Streptomyces physcomitrii]